MDNEEPENNSDTDLGSGGAPLLPPMKHSSGKIWQLAAGAGKDSNLYILNCNSMGKFNPNGNDIYQELREFCPVESGQASFFCRQALLGASGSDYPGFSVQERAMAVRSSGPDQ